MENVKKLHDLFKQLGKISKETKDFADAALEKENPFHHYPIYTIYGAIKKEALDEIKKEFMIAPPKTPLKPGQIFLHEFGPTKEFPELIEVFLKYKLKQKLQKT